MANFYQSYVTAMDNKTFRMPTSRLGAPTHPGVAKQLEEFGKMLNQGIKNVEVGALSPEKFETIPKEHFEEIRRLAKITDSNVSVHGPLMDLAGFPEQSGGKWSEDQRKGTEEQLYSILERTFDLSKGENIPVVFHAGHMQSQEFQKGLEVTQYDEKGRGKVTKPELGFRSVVAVNQDNGDLAKLEYEKKYHLGEEKPVIWDPMKRLHNLNETFWDDEKLKLLQRQKELQELRDKFEMKLKQNEAIENSNLKLDPAYSQIFEKNQIDISLLQGHIQDIHQKLASEYQDIYHRFVKFTPEKTIEENKKALEEMNKNYKEANDKYTETYKNLIKLSKEMEKTASPEEKKVIEEQLNKRQLELFEIPLDQSKAILSHMAPLPAPQLWRWTGEFAIEKTAETVSNALARLYINHKKEGKADQLPFIALENFFVNTPMSTAKDLKKVVELSKEKLAEKLAESKDMKVSENEAKKIAEKLIGATWDVGHINNLRKAGLEGKELQEKLIKETKEIAGVVKHVHITDNFGFNDSHLPPGMGNVPIREIMEELEKKWSEMRKRKELGQEPRAIIEAGGFVAEIGQNPQLAVLEYFGSPLYKISPSPYFWGPAAQSIAHTYTPYLETFIEFPQQHFNLYGSSFTTLPKSVGGQVGEGSSRFAGTPNQ